MSSEDYEANGIGDEDDDENEELEEDTEDESEDHLSERITERRRFRAWQRETPETSQDDRLRWFVSDHVFLWLKGSHVLQSFLAMCHRRMAVASSIVATTTSTNVNRRSGFTRASLL